jgi:hypothetical protein
VYCVHRHPVPALRGSWSRRSSGRERAAAATPTATPTRGSRSGFSANRRLLGVQRLSHNPIRAAGAFRRGARPDRHRRWAARRRATPGRGPRPRPAAGAAGVPAAPARIPSARPGRLPTELLGKPHQRRLRAHGLITRIPRTHRYRVTGLHHAMLLAHLHPRLLEPGLAQLTDANPPAPSGLRTAAHNYQRPSINSPKTPDSPHNPNLRSNPLRRS